MIWLILTSFCIIEDDRLQILFILQGDLADSDLVGLIEDDRLLILFILQGDLADSDLVGTNRRRKAADIVYFSS